MEHGKPDVETDVLVPVATLLTQTTCVVEGNDHAVPLFECGDGRADFFDDPAELVSEDEWDGWDDADPRPSAMPDVVVGEADSIRLDAQHGIGRVALWIWPIGMHHQGFANLFDDGSTARNRREVPRAIKVIGQDATAVGGLWTPWVTRFEVVDAKFPGVFTE